MEKTETLTAESTQCSELHVKKESEVSKLWNKNFFLLWQGQLVSAFGDVIYSIALGFWIMQKTGSTALMGSLVAVSSIPRIVISPFAGVLVDRWDRKKLIVLMDFIRGVAILFVAATALFGGLQIWMVFAAGIILSCCSAFFNPSISSTMPDIVPKSKLVKANSAMNIVYTGSNLIANPLGGILFSILHAPIMFLVNGISYIFSAFTELFIKVPKIERENVENNFWREFKDGFKFIWNFKGLRKLVTAACGLNFFATMALVLLIPFFQKTPGLGSGKYGFAMSALSIGSILGMVFSSSVDVPYSKRFALYSVFALAFPFVMGTFPFSPYILMLGLLFVGGFCIAIINVYIGATIQIVVPQNMRGKVSSLQSTLVMGLTPISMALGGVLAEFIPIKYVISTSFMFTLLGMISLLLSKDFKNLINFNPDEQTLQDIM
ncbi:MFS transporter [Oceanirhabdus sp. W0125-5]|uniref:MFS transporter n=1 Tax=Oceanirhabdus sp. W0125-5 TaxID=2999116 RepID=UPI0022F31EA9|nr:MFS transporter [Oceanirhabdus sp. W0125-5]WBW99005.1 MFS transporter [Oceanirhabdus sp. W0125-5]